MPVFLVFASRPQHFQTSGTVTYCYFPASRRAGQKSSPRRYNCHIRPGYGNPSSRPANSKYSYFNKTDRYNFPQLFLYYKDILIFSPGDVTVAIKDSTRLLHRGQAKKFRRTGGRLRTRRPMKVCYHLDSAA